MRLNDKEDIEKFKCVGMYTRNHIMPAVYLVFAIWGISCVLTWLGCK